MPGTAPEVGDTSLRPHLGRERVEQGPIERLVLQLAEEVLRVSLGECVVAAGDVVQSHTLRSTLAQARWNGSPAHAVSSRSLVRLNQRNSCPEPSPRPRSVVARTELRRAVARGTFFMGPVATLLGFSICVPLGIATLQACLLVLATLTAWDAVVLVGTWRAARRMKSGQLPVRPDTDYGIGRDEWTRTVRATAAYRAQDRVELVARGSPIDAAVLLLRNLLYRLAGLAGIAFVTALLAAICTTRPHGDSCPHVLRAALNTMRQAALQYEIVHPGASCPTSSELRQERFIDDGFSDRDSWGRPMELSCSGKEIVCRSAGPDRVMGTWDDIVVPEPMDASVGRGWPPCERLEAR
jgi:hypothetical protein